MLKGWLRAGREEEELGVVICEFSPQMVEVGGVGCCSLLEVGLGKLLGAEGLSQEADAGGDLMVWACGVFLPDVVEGCYEGCSVWRLRLITH